MSTRTAQTDIKISHLEADGALIGRSGTTADSGVSHSERKPLSKRQARRTIDKDARALAAWPWLGELGKVIDEALPPASTGRPRAFNGASLLLLDALRWRVKALSHAEGYLACHWDAIRRHGLEHGVYLNERPPTWENLRTLRDQENFEMLLEALDGPFIDAAIATAEAIGLLPDREGDTITPVRTAHLQGDGTVVDPMSKVSVDSNGEVHGSRAKVLGPRIAEQLISTKNHRPLYGYPLTTWTLRGDQTWQRVVMAVAPHPANDEVVVAEKSLYRILDRTDMVRTIGYDALLMGAAQQRIMRRGVLPIAEHGSGDSKVKDPRKVIRLPDELVQKRGSKATTEKRKGKGRRRRSSSGPRQKRYMAVAKLPDAVHDTPNGPCHHQLAAIDTCLVVHDGGTDPDWWHRTEVPSHHRIERVDNGDGSYSLFGVWRLRCEHMDRANRYFEHRQELSGNIGKAVMANRLNAYPYVHPQSDGIYGWRNDIESYFQWLKRNMPFFGQATSLRYHDFMFDVYGACVLSNAIAYQLHARTNGR